MTTPSTSRDTAGIQHIPVGALILALAFTPAWRDLLLERRRRHPVCTFALVIAALAMTPTLLLGLLARLFVVTDAVAKQSAHYRRGVIAIIDRPGRQRRRWGVWATVAIVVGVCIWYSDRIVNPIHDAIGSNGAAALVAWAIIPMLWDLHPKSRRLVKGSVELSAVARAPWQRQKGLVPTTLRHWVPSGARFLAYERVVNRFYRPTWPNATYKPVGGRIPLIRQGLYLVTV